MPFWSSKKSIDPVCGMEVEEKKAAATYEYQGKTYYFCAAACKNSFQKEPQKYLGGQAMQAASPNKQPNERQHGSHGGHGCCG